MLSRGFAVASMLGLATIAQAGATVQFVIDPAPCAPASPGGNSRLLVNTEYTVHVELLQEAGGSDQRLRMVELDLRQSSPFLAVTLPTTHDLGTAGTADDIRFWSFGSVQSCINTPSFCGFNHYIDDDMPAGAVDTRTDVLSSAFFGLAVDPTAQVTLLGGARPFPLRIGTLKMTPTIAGAATLNVLNAADADPNRRARIDFGFDPHITWRAGNPAGTNIAGGVQSFDVVTICGPPPCTANLVSSVPPFTAVGSAAIPTNGVLWRTTRHVARLTFSGALPVTPPTVSQIEIVELLPAGAFGPNLMPGTFQLTIEGGNILRIRESATASTVLGDNRWFAVRNTGNWTGVCNFEAQFPVNVGDADGNRFVTPIDVSQINAAPPGAVSDQSRVDINGDGFKTPIDVSLANSSQGPPPGKPSGH